MYIKIIKDCFIVQIQLSVFVLISVIIMLSTHTYKSNGINQNNVDSNNKLALINLANEVWGEYEWNYSVTNEKIDFIDNISDEYSVSAVAFVKITLKSGISHEDLGCAAIKSSDKGLAVSQARQKAIVNALREVLCTFGDRFISRLSVKECLNEPNSIRSEEIIPENINTVENVKTNKRKLLNEIDNNSSDGMTMKNEMKSGSFYTSTPILNNGKVTKMNRDQSAESVVETTNLKSSFVNPETSPKNNPIDPNVNCLKPVPKKMTEEEIRAERLRRQKLMQEQYRKQMK